MIKGLKEQLAIQPCVILCDLELFISAVALHVDHGEVSCSFQQLDAAWVRGVHYQGLTWKCSNQASKLQASDLTLFTSVMACQILCHVMVMQPDSRCLFPAMIVISMLSGVSTERMHGSEQGNNRALGGGWRGGLAAVVDHPQQGLLYQNVQFVSTCYVFVCALFVHMHLLWKSGVDRQEKAKTQLMKYYSL